jgi:hypothetical protein
MIPIQAEMHPPVGPQPQLQHRQWFAFEREEHGKVPIEEIDVQAWTLGYQGIQERTKFSWRRTPDVLWGETDAAIDVPTNNENRFLGLLGCCHKGSEIRRAIDQERRPPSSGYAPAIPSFR